MYKIEYMDGNYLEGTRGCIQWLGEPFLSRRIIVTGASESLEYLLGKTINIPVDGLRYFGEMG